MTAKRKQHYVYKHDGLCQGRVSKSPTGMPSGVYSGLHGWMCLSCGKRGVKVSRIFEEPIAPEVPVTSPTSKESEGKVN